MSAATDLRVIADELVGTLSSALQPGWIGFYLRRKEGAPFEILESAPGEIGVTRLLEACEEAVSPIEDESGHLAVPFRAGGQLCGVLLLGARRPRRIFTGEDRRLLKTLANQGALALQHAFAIDDLRQGNHELEWRVANRTRELDDALAELREKNQLLQHLSTTDSLTRLRNRASLDDSLETEFARARRYGSSLAVLMVDMDHFKQVNDRYGHQAGDAVLRRVGELITQQLRSCDIAGRYGGEEFMVIHSPGLPRGGGLMLAERIRQSVEHELFEGPSGESFHVTLSVGSADLRFEHGSGEQLVGEADAALYRAKSLGRNRVESEVRG